MIQKLLYVSLDETLKRLQEKITSDLKKLIINVGKVKDFEHDITSIVTEGIVI
jgi:hypothetical protein